MKKPNNHNECIALHETGHVIALYALGRYNEFQQTSIVPQGGTMGQTQRSPFNGNIMNQAMELMRSLLMGNTEESKERRALSILPYVCFYYGGGSADRLWGDDYPSRNTIDMSALKTNFSLLAGCSVTDVALRRLQPIVDRFMHEVLRHYEALVERLTAKLTEQKTINKHQMDNLLTQWHYNANKTNMDNALLGAKATFEREYLQWYRTL